MDRHDAPTRTSSPPATPPASPALTPPASPTTTPGERSLEQVHVSAGLGRLHRTRAALLASRAEIVLWTEPNGINEASDPDRLVSTLQAALGKNRGLDFAFAVSPTIEAPPARLIPRRPIEVVALAVRAHALPLLGPIGLGPPELHPIDLGPPDAVLDAATGWVLASVLALCQCDGLGLCPGEDWKSVRSPESIGGLSPVGIAWLITQAQRWARQVRDTRPLDREQPPDNICMVPTLGDEKPHTLHAAPTPLHAPLPAPLVQSTLELGAGR